VVGVEQDEAAATVAARFYDEFIIADVEAGLRLSRKFDVIVLADVLEHLPHPLNVLVHLPDLLSSTGRFIRAIESAFWTL
jgi:2-polyprenyl-3-methyl-5-hydroxy-6-metoxy-1,4-benzoquinol methylase